MSWGLVAFYTSVAAGWIFVAWLFSKLAWAGGERDWRIYALLAIWPISFVGVPLWDLLVWIWKRGRT